MKRLGIIRHAKSSWADAGLADHDRPLNKRGKRDAPFMADLLEREGERPDLLLTSSAKRARTTAKAFAKAFGLPKGAVLEDERIYEASAHAVLDVLRAGPEHAESLFLFGHNPGLHDLIFLLCGKGPERFVTCGAALMDLSIDRWRDAAIGCGTLTAYWYPKMFEI